LDKAPKHESIQEVGDATRAIGKRIHRVRRISYDSDTDASSRQTYIFSIRVDIGSHEMKKNESKKRSAYDENRFFILAECLLETHAKIVKMRVRLESPELGVDIDEGCQEYIEDDTHDSDLVEDLLWSASLEFSKIF